MARLALAHVVGGLGFPRLPVGEHDVEVHVLVVHGEDVLVSVSVERHAVVVVAVGGLLAFAGAATRMVEGGACRPERIAPAGHHMPAVAVGYGNRVEAVGGDGREIETRHRSARAAAPPIRRHSAQTRSRRRPRCRKGIPAARSPARPAARNRWVRCAGRSCGRHRPVRPHPVRPPRDRACPSPVVE